MPQGDPPTVTDTLYTDTVTGASLVENAGTATSSPVSTTGGRFVSGFDPRRNIAGRIKKAPTVLDETAKLAHRTKNRKRIASAWVETMAEAGTAAGNRARADFSDRLYGLPKQTLVLEQGESAAAAFLMRHNARVVDAESRLLVASSETDDIT